MMAGGWNMEGMGTLIVVGAATMVVGWLAGIPAAISGALWLVAPRIDWSMSFANVYLWSLSIWAGIHLMVCLYVWVVDPLIQRNR